ncbi:MAG: DUF4249 domain-containing protein [Saprospiraceae bacterium]
MNTAILSRTILLFALALFASCEEVIELKLDNTEPRTVIEANLDATLGTCTVLLSRTSDFYSDNNFEHLVGASVVLTGPDGQPITLNETSTGRYQAVGVSAKPGDLFALSIRTPEGEEYAATAEAPRLVPLDSLFVEKNESGGIRPGGASGPVENYELSLQWTDPAGEANFYRARIYRNGGFLSELYVMSNDVLGDGTLTTRPIIRQNFAEGDQLRVQHLSVSKGYFDYFSELANTDGRGLSSPAPYNPKGNFSPPVLGYFGIWHVSEKSVTVQ